MGQGATRLQAEREVGVVLGEKSCKSLRLLAFELRNVEYDLAVLFWVRQPVADWPVPLRAYVYRRADAVRKEAVAHKLQSPVSIRSPHKDSPCTLQGPSRQGRRLDQASSVTSNKVSAFTFLSLF